MFADPAKVHRADHVGQHFRVAGPLNVAAARRRGARCWCRPGSSETGKAFAARYAEAVFTAQRTLADGQAFYADLKGRLAAYGRRPEDLAVLPGIVPFIAPTEAEARALEQEFTDLISPDYALRQLSGMLGVDLTDHPLDAPLPPVPPVDAIEGNKSRYQLVRDLAEGEDLTVRQLIARLGGGRGHRTFAGTPEQVADEIQTWFEQGAADGFNVMPPYLPGGLDVFVDTVVPILQDRGLFRREYEGTTLRENLGLRPHVNRYTIEGRALAVG